MTLPALFHNHRESLLGSVVTMVEDVLGDMGLDLEQTRVTDTTALYEWRLAQGSAEVRIQIVDHTNGARLRLRSAVMTLPTTVDRAAAFARLLALNVELGVAAFACIDRQVLLVAERPTRDLDRSEVEELMRQLPALADNYDDDLVAQFGGVLGGSLS